MFCHRLIPPPPVRLDLALNKKDTTLPVIYKNQFRSILSEYKDAKVIYCDGSKTSNGTASAVLFEGRTFAWSLSTFASIFTAELYAIWKATQMCRETANNNIILICSDSLSSLKSISKPSNIHVKSNSLISSILTNVWHLHHANKNIIFIWTPGHIGIEGNSIVDEAARKAAETMQPNVHFISREDHSKGILETMTKQWQAEWNETPSKLYEIKSEIRHWKYPPDLTRREQVIISRLRIGHTRLTSSYLLIGDPPPICEVCNETLTVKHILESCILYYESREMCLLKRSINEILQNRHSSIKALLRFCNLSGILHRI